MSNTIKPLDDTSHMDNTTVSTAASACLCRSNDISQHANSTYESVLLWRSAAQELHQSSPIALHPSLTAAITPAPAPPPSPHSPLPTSSHESPHFKPLRGVGVNVVNIFWERLSTALGEEANDAPTIRKPRLRPIESVVKLTVETGLKKSTILRIGSTTTTGIASSTAAGTTSSSSVVISSSSLSRHSFRSLRMRGIDLVRFAASPYCPHQLALWRRGGEQQALYYQLLDSVFDDAEAAGIRLVPTLMWRAVLPSLSCGEPLGVLFDPKQISCARSLLYNYSLSLVERYKHRPLIVAWELMNELDLQADLKHRDGSKSEVRAEHNRPLGSKQHRTSHHHRKGGPNSATTNGTTSAGIRRRLRIGGNHHERSSTSTKKLGGRFDRRRRRLTEGGKPNCHWNAAKGTTVCMRQDGSKWIAPGKHAHGHGNSSSGSNSIALDSIRHHASALSSSSSGTRSSVRTASRSSLSLSDSRSKNHHSRWPLPMTLEEANAWARNTTSSSDTVYGTSEAQQQQRRSQCLVTARDEPSCNCSGWKMGPSGDFSSHRMFALERDLVEKLRLADSPLQGGLGRPFSSGHALPRGFAWHMAHSSNARDRWKLDSVDQFCRYLLESHAHVELVSLHPYIKRRLSNESSDAVWEEIPTLVAPNDAPTKNGPPVEMKLADLVAAAQTCVAQSTALGRPYPKQLYLGEFGFRQHDNVTLDFVRDLLRLTTRNAPQPLASTRSTRSSSTAAAVLAPVATVASDSVQSSTSATPTQEAAPPPLATIWVWEFEPQHNTLSLEAGRDDWLIEELVEANRATHELGEFIN